LPGHPIVREPVLARLVEAAHDAGVTLRFDRSGGNLWRGITLRGVEVRAEGVELRATEARLGWFLPPLVTGELPLRVHLTDLTGDVDVARALAARAPTEPAEGGLPLPRLLWREVEINGADVTIADVPFTLPDVQVVDIGVSGDGDDLALFLTLRTADGSADLVGRADAGTGHVALQVVAADATLARAWWDGVTAGTVRGEVRIGDGIVTAEGHVEDGTIEAYGARVDAISGPVRWDGARVHTELSGSGAGGTVVAQGIVDVPAARWSATGRADVALEALTPILWGLGVAGPPPPSEGRVTAAVRVEGWTSARLEVDAVVDGSVYGVRAEAFDAEVRFGDGRLSVLGSGAFADGQLDLRVDVADAITDVAASLVGGAWGPVAIDALEGALRFGAESTGSAVFSGSLALGDGVPISADMALDADGASLFVESAEVAGARLRGALVAPRLAGDAPLDGGLQLLLPDVRVVGAGPRRLAPGRWHARRARLHAHRRRRCAGATARGPVGGRARPPRRRSPRHRGRRRHARRRARRGRGRRRHRRRPFAHAAPARAGVDGSRRPRDTGHRGCAWRRRRAAGRSSTTPAACRWPSTPTAGGRSSRRWRSTWRGSSSPSTARPGPPPRAAGAPTSPSPPRRSRHA
jgi:hypothetical protein